MTLEIEKKIERYLGFYLSKPFWAREKLDVDSLAKDDGLFNYLMSEEVFKFENNDFKIMLCRDGQFLIKIRPLS